MDQPRPLPSTYPSPQLPPDEQLLRLREPLTDAAGNSQLHGLTPVGFFQDDKGHQPRLDMQFPITLPSNRPRQALGSTLENRRHVVRRRRQQRFMENPVFHSHQYQNYRNRQNREGNSEDAKWPAVLEDAFLDALVDIPIMGRKKYSYKGKPYGRNELIQEYLWIAYCQSLPPDQTPDQTMRRTRKQVSSHIQVIKGFLKEHPASLRLFPPKKDPKNGFEVSLKNDPCLRALSEGRLPTRKYEYFDNSTQMAFTPPKPVVFWLLITVDETVYHQYTMLSSPRCQESLESISVWRQKFPYLEQLDSIGDINCDIIHMEVSLDLMRSHAPEKAQLRTRLELSVPSRELEDCQWQTVTSLIKPDELYRDPREDPPLEAKAYIADVLSVNDDEIRIKIPFPAISWAHAFTSLTDLQLKYEDSQRRSLGEHGADGHTGPARELTKHISMYQEVQSCAGPDSPFNRRAIILWTFRKVRDGEAGSTTWRYVDASPPRSSCMSPSPHLNHRITASMNEKFHSFLDNSMHSQQPTVLDHFVQGISTPTTTTALQSPFVPTGYPCPSQNYELPHEINFDSSATLDSESTLVGETANIDTMLSNANVSLGGFDHNPAPWHLNHTESFDADSAWAAYATVPSSSQQLGWEPDKNHNWPETTEKQTHWMDDVNGKHEWTSAGANEQNFTKLPSWLDQSANETSTDFPNTNNTALPEFGFVLIDTRDPSWAGSDGFDYGAMAESLK